MSHVVIIGSGMAGIGLAELLAQDSKFSVTVVSGETSGYYSRPLLSHAFASEKVFGRTVLSDVASLQKKFRFIAGKAVAQILPEVKQVRLEGGEKIDYDMLVLATGSEAFVPPLWLPYQQNFLTLNRYHDAVTIRNLRASGARRWAVVGGGLIGCEIASDLAKAGDEVVLVHAVDRLMERIFSPEDSARLSEHLQQQKIEILLNTTVTAFTRENGRTRLSHAGGAIEVDAAIVAVGFRPRTALAAAAGLNVNRGIVADHQFRTSVAGIYAIGDGAEIGGNLYPFVAPIRAQVKHFAGLLWGTVSGDWTAPGVKVRIKVHGFA